MNFITKKEELKSLLRNHLLPLINGRCVFLELPYYPNIGDLLI